MAELLEIVFKQRGDGVIQTCITGSIVCLYLTLGKIAIWLSKNCQKLEIFFKKIDKNCLFFSTKLPMAILLKKNDNFCQFFDIQMSIFCRVRQWPTNGEVVMILETLQPHDHHFGVGPRQTGWLFGLGAAGLVDRASRRGHVGGGSGGLSLHRFPSLRLQEQRVGFTCEWVREEGGRGESDTAGQQRRGFVCWKRDRFGQCYLHVVIKIGLFTKTPFFHYYNNIDSTMKLW